MDVCNKIFKSGPKCHWLKIATLNKQIYRNFNLTRKKSIKLKQYTVVDKQIIIIVINVSEASKRCDSTKSIVQSFEVSDCFHLVKYDCEFLITPGPH